MSRAPLRRLAWCATALLVMAAITLRAADGAAQLPSFEDRVGQETVEGWVVESVEQQPEYIRLHFVRDDERAHVEIIARTQLETDVASEHHSLQAAPEGFAPEGVQEEVLAWLHEAENAPTEAELERAALARSVQVGRVITLLQGVLALAVFFGLLGALSHLRDVRQARLAQRAPEDDGDADDGAHRRPRKRAAAWVRHASPLVVLTASGALLRVAQGIRTPGFEGRHGEPYGYADIAATLGLGAPGLDPNGSGMAALTELWFALLPREEWALLALQASLGILIIPLVYLAALAWLRVQREATWAAAIYALVPCAAYFAMTEVRPVPGAFFVLLSLVVTGAGLSAGRALWLLSGGLFALVATSFHPVLLPAPLVLGLLWVARRDAWPLLRQPRVHLALASVAAVWAILLRLSWLQLSLGATDAVLGGDPTQALQSAWRVVLPTLGLPDAPFNAFLNVHCTPALAVGCWFAAALAVRQPERRATLLTLFAAAALMTLPGMVGGRYNLPRLQYAAVPLHAMLAGAGSVAILHAAFVWLGPARARRYRHLVPALLALGLGVSVAMSPGPLSDPTVYEGERRVALRAVPALLDAGRTCEVWLPPTPEGPYALGPTYLTLDAIAPNRWRSVSAPEAARIEVGRSLRRYGCGYYYRPAICWTQRADELPSGEPDGPRDECVAVERRLHLTPLHVESIPAHPAAAVSYRRPLVEVGFFRVDGVVL